MRRGTQETDPHDAKIEGHAGGGLQRAVAAKEEREICGRLSAAAHMMRARRKEAKKEQQRRGKHATKKIRLAFSHGYASHTVKVRLEL